MLFNCPDFSTQAAFRTINPDHGPLIDFDILNKYLKSKGVNPTKEDITAFIRRLDSDLDCKILIDEFSAGILPIGKKAKIRPAYTTTTKAQLARSGPKKNIKSKIKKASTKSKKYEKTNRATIPKEEEKQEIIEENPEIKQEQKGIEESPNRSSPGILLMNSEPTKKESPIPVVIQDANEIAERSRKPTAKKPKNATLNKKENLKPKVKKKAYRSMDISKGNIAKSDMKSKTHKLKPTPKTAEKKKKGKFIPGGQSAELYKLFSAQLIFEKKIEIVKQDIASQLDASKSAIISLLNPANKPFILPTDFYNAIHGMNLKKYTKEDTDILFRKFDKNYDGYIKPNELEDICMPWHPQFLQAFKTRVAKMKPKKDTIAILNRLFQITLETEKENEKIKQGLKITNYDDAFLECDARDLGYFTEEDMRHFLKCYGVSDSPEDVVLLYNRYDKNKDGKVILSEVIILLIIHI